jgi:ribosome biogenesis GTPase
MNHSQLLGQVLYGINNIYTVLIEGRELSCRIRGKVLKIGEDKDSLPDYNPIAVGDWVKITPDPHSERKGWIRSRINRRSRLVRFNKKRRAPQVIAANLDLLVCVGSVKNPPFRPRFVDRILVSAHFGNVDPLIFINKCDLGIEEDVTERVGAYTRSGYKVILGSALNGDGLAELKDRLAGKTAVFVGHSGVGKSYLLNRLDPSLNLRVGDISQKYNRGEHTTTFAVMVRLGDSCWVIDTPGIRELDVYGVKPEELKFFFPEFTGPAEHCAYSSCNHIEEPDCAVKEQLELGGIHPDRYESYIRIFQHLQEFYRRHPDLG